MKRVQNPTTYFFQQADKVQNHNNTEIQMFSQSLLQKQSCPLCKDKYHLKEEDRIPRILIHCGHTFCTKCLTHFYTNKRVRCPMCLKLVKKIHNINALPINHTIYTYLAQKDLEKATETNSTPMETDPHKFIYSEFIRSMGANSAKISPPEYDKDAQLQCCVFHPDRVEHFFCMFHQNPGCRKCMQQGHKLPKCRVLDLYDLKKPEDQDQILIDIEREIQQMQD